MICESMISNSLDSMQNKKPQSIFKKETRSYQRKKLNQMMAILSTSGLSIKQIKPTYRQRSQKKKYWQQKRIHANDTKNVHYPSDEFSTENDDNDDENIDFDIEYYYDQERY